MASFSSGDSEVRSGGRGGDVFIGSFNINSGDLSDEAARAWLKGAEDADIVALGLQECTTVPANPFPEPTNGKAIAMWKHVKDLAVPEANHSNDMNGIFNNSTDDEDGGDSGIGGWGSPAMAGVAQAAMSAALTASRKAKKARAGSPLNDSANLPPCAASASAMSGQGGEERPNSPGAASSRPVRLDDTKSDGSAGTCPKGMRQESYYLRGVIEADRDKNFLTTIADCIPGRCLVADVAMGETPTHGKIVVNVSRNDPSTTASKASSKEGTSSSAAAAVEAALAATCSLGSSGEGLDAMGGDGLDAVGGDGPLDASGRPGWSVGDSGKGGVSTGGSADAANGAVLKKVEWYGTIRLLVFVRKGLYKDLKVRTVVIPAGDKPSVVADAPEDYAKDTSPDKGAVACYLEDASSESPLQLLLVNCHLYGTNKYGVKEAVFDKYRMEQLRAIDFALAATLPTAATAPLVLLGDLNFRVEVLSGTDDKAKGGNDFQEVRKLAEMCDPKGLLDLYNRADRLRLVLEGGEGEGRDSPFMEEAAQVGTGPRATQIKETELPSLLKGLKDGLRASLMHGQAVRPTFTYKPRDTSSTPRRFNDKRTPSWTDRVLWRGFADDETYHPHPQQKDHPAGHLQQHANTTFAAVPEVIASDHEPVYCLLGLPRRTWAS